jgi:hypothetical protein
MKSLDPRHTTYITQLWWLSPFVTLSSPPFVTREKKEPSIRSIAFDSQSNIWYLTTPDK